MKNLDKIVFGMILGSLFPILLAMLAFIFWFYFKQEAGNPIFYLSGGLMTGLLIDLILYRKWIVNPYRLPVWFMSGIFIFYNIMMYGFFMGFPVFNISLALLAGYYIANRLKSNHEIRERFPKIIRQVSIFTGTVMAILCVSTGIIAISDQYTGNDLQGMFRLGFEVTKTMIWAIVIIGGIFLILAEIILTRIAFIKTLEFK
jgi:hypothetical protein